MKQRITTEQLNELTEEQKTELRNWWKPVEGDHFSDGNWYGDLIWVDNIQDEYYTFYKCKNTDEYTILFGYHQLYEDENNPENSQDAVYDVYPLLSIGQMVEFLGDNFLHINRIQIDNKIGWQIEKSWDDLSGNVKQLSKSNLELCDALWEAVKYILQDKTK